MINRSQAVLLAIAGLLALPVLLATALFYSGWQPGGRPNGELLQPPRSLAVPLSSADGRSLTLATDRWHLVVAGTGACNDDCFRLLDEARRIHVALYKKMPHVDRMWVTDDLPKRVGDMARLRQQQPDLIAAQALPAAASGFDLEQPGHRIYLMDPNGRVVMRYRADAKPKDVLKDMERLLRYS